MERRQLISCTIKPAPGERSRSITIPCADGSAYQAVVWAKSRLIFTVEESAALSAGLAGIRGWIYVTYIGEVIPGVIQVEVKESNGQRTPLQVRMIDVRGVDDLQSLLFSWATHYYTMARFGAVEQLTPVCSNLFHYAVEMYLKGYICVRSVKDLKNEFKHNIVKLWEEFKTIQDTPDPTLKRFNDTISTLHKFEDIRYPDKVIELGMLATINFEAFDSSTLSPNSLRQELKYRLVVDEIDSLVQVIFEKSNIAPIFFARQLNEGAHNYLTRWNKVGVWS